MKTHVIALVAVIVILISAICWQFAMIDEISKELYDFKQDSKLFLDCEEGSVLTYTKDKSFHCVVDKLGGVNSSIFWSIYGKQGLSGDYEGNYNLNTSGNISVNNLSATFAEIEILEIMNQTADNIIVENLTTDFGVFELLNVSNETRLNGTTYIGHPSGSNYIFVNESGFIILNGDARVSKRLQINIAAFKGAGSNPATDTTYGLNGAFEFSKTITESIAEASAVPFDLDKSNAPYFTIGWSSGEATGTCVWQLEVLYRQIDEDWSSTTPDETILLNATPSTTSNGLRLTTFTLPLLNESDAGMIFRLSRIGGSPYDDMDGVAYVFGGAIDYTANKFGGAAP